ncbi:MAG: hypothetical protein ACRETG_08245 [Steroidobacteraceae bacterium]
MDDSTMKLGLLLEGAHAHQTLAETTLEQLRAHVGELEGIAREEIRTTLLEELRALGEDSRRAAETLRSLRHVANLRVMLWSVGMAALSCAVPLCAAWWILPSREEIAALSARRDALATSVAHLTRQGGQIELRRCGVTQRLCVRVDRKAPVYGQSGDYLVVKGY